MLRHLLQYDLCPHDVCHRTSGERGHVEDENLVSLSLDVGGNDMLFTLFKTCEPRCCCRKCERALAFGRFDDTDCKDTFRHVSGILDNVDRLTDHMDYDNGGSSSDDS